MFLSLLIKVIVMIMVLPFFCGYIEFIPDSIKDLSSYGQITLDIPIRGNTYNVVIDPFRYVFMVFILIIIGLNPIMAMLLAVFIMSSIDSLNAFFRKTEMKKNNDIETNIVEESSGLTDTDTDTDTEEKLTAYEISLKTQPLGKGDPRILHNNPYLSD